METFVTDAFGKIDSPRQLRIRKGIAIVSMLAGAGWVAMATIPPIVNLFSDPEGETHLWFLLIMVPFLCIPGVLCLYFGYNLFDRRTEYNLCGIIGTVTFLSILLTGIRAGEWLEPWISKFKLEGVGTLFVAFATATIYPLTAAKLLPLIGGEQKRAREFVSKQMLTLIAFLVFFGLITFWGAQHEISTTRIFTNLPMLDAIFGLFITLTPFLLPYIGYKIAVRYFVGEKV